MKKLAILTEESVLSGAYRTGVAEVADSLAYSMTPEYAVTVVCPDGDGLLVRMTAEGQTVSEGVRRCRLFGVDYCLVDRARWPEAATALLGELKPDVLHSFATPELLADVRPRPERCVYTVDRAEALRGREAALRDYDAVTTVSESYARELLAAGDELSSVLRELPFRGITNGILTEVFTPEKGLLLAAKYTPADQAGKDLCKAHLLKTYGIPEGKCLWVMLTRMTRDKGADLVLDALPEIREKGGFVLFAGRGEAEIEERLAALTREDGALWLKKRREPQQMLPLLAGADFCLNPSRAEPCGLTPMTAAHYGTIPIVTQAGGLKDNMDGRIAVLVGEGGMTAAVSEAAALYADPFRLYLKRKAAMERDFGWKTRKTGYLEVYEG